MFGSVEAARADLLGYLESTGCRPAWRALSGSSHRRELVVCQPPLAFGIMRVREHERVEDASRVFMQRFAIPRDALLGETVRVYTQSARRPTPAPPAGGGCLLMMAFLVMLVSVLAVSLSS